MAVAQVRQNEFASEVVLMRHCACTSEYINLTPSTQTCIILLDQGKYQLALDGNIACSGSSVVQNMIAESALFVFVLTLRIVFSDTQSSAEPPTKVPDYSAKAEPGSLVVLPECSPHLEDPLASGAHLPAASNAGFWTMSRHVLIEHILA